MTPPIPPKKKRKHNGTSLIFILILLLIAAFFIYLIGTNLNLFNHGQHIDGDDDEVAGAPADTTKDKDEIINWLDAPVSAPVPVINRDSLAQERAKEERLRREKEAAAQKAKQAEEGAASQPVEVVIPETPASTSAPSTPAAKPGAPKPAETKPATPKPASTQAKKPAQKANAGGEALFE